MDLPVERLALSHTVLLVDDAAHVRNVVRDVLSLASYSVLEADNGGHALTLLRAVAADVVVSDYRMPALDGLALLKALRDEGRQIPFVLWSSDLPEPVRLQAQTLGATTGEKANVACIPGLVELALRGGSGR